MKVTKTNKGNKTQKGNGGKSKLRILWHGVPAEYGTGYGTQTNLFTTWLKARGHELCISSIIPGDVRRIDRNGIQVLPPLTRSSYGNDMILGHASEFRPDCVLSCMDTHVMDPKQFSRLFWIAWQVVDSEPLPPEVAAPAPAARSRLAMSRFGQRVLQQANLSSTYVPLTYSRNEYGLELDVEKREGYRKWLAQMTGAKITPNTFLVVMNSANMSAPSRKNFYAAFQGFELFRQRVMSTSMNPEPILYCHTEPTGKFFRGEDLLTIAEKIGVPKSALFFPPQYPYLTGKITPAFLRTIYQAADVFLHTARGEGFGLPLVEAQACGLPVIAPNHSACAELAAARSLLLERLTPFASSSGTVQFLVDPHEVAERLERVWLGHQVPDRETVAKFVSPYELEKVGPILEAALFTALASRVGRIEYEVEPETEAPFQSLTVSKNGKGGNVKC